MARTLKSIMNRLSPARRAKIEGRAKELLEENRLAEKAEGKTEQKQVTTKIKRTTS